MSKEKRIDWKKEAKYWEDKAWNALRELRRHIDEHIEIRVEEKDFEDLAVGDMIIVEVCGYNRLKEITKVETTLLHDHKYIELRESNSIWCNKHYKHEHKGKVKVVTVM